MSNSSIAQRIPWVLAAVVWTMRFSTTNSLLFGQPPRRHLLTYRDLWPQKATVSTGRTGLNSSSKRRRTKNYYRAATKEDDTTTWSKKALRNESRLGVRRRVKAVLARARERTGVSNDSETYTTSTKARSSFLGADSNLGLEATTKRSPTASWSVRNGQMAADFLDSDATLSLLLAEEDETATVSSFSTLSYPSVKFMNGKQPGNGDAPAGTDSAQGSTRLRYNGNSMQNGYSLNNGASIPQRQTLSSKNGVGKIKSAESAKNKVKAEELADNTTSASAGTKPSNTLTETTTAAEAQPLPFELPTLTKEQEARLKAGERVQEQEKMGGEGSGFVVFDIPAPEYAIWEVLLDFEAYPENIGTVRSMTMFTNKHLKQSFFAEKPLPPGDTSARQLRHFGKACISRASFVLSKFKLNIAAIHRYQPHPDGHFMVFTLDPACKNVVLKDAKGIWYTESDPAGAKKGTTRVWLLCELKVSSLLPRFIVDYAAERAMPRATTWLPSAVQRFLAGQKQ